RSPMFIDCYEEKFSAPLGAEYVAPKGAITRNGRRVYKDYVPTGLWKTSPPSRSGYCPAAQHHLILTIAKSENHVHKSSRPAGGRADRETALHGPALHRARLRDRRPVTRRISLSENRDPSIRCLHSEAPSRSEFLWPAPGHGPDRLPTS